MKCMFCKTDISTDFYGTPLCGSDECFNRLQYQNINLYRKIKFLRSVYAHTRINRDKTEIRLSVSRPWSSDCVLNLFENLQNHWPALKSAKETRRTIGDIKKMAGIINTEGFDKVFLTLLKIETLKKSELSDEMAWLKEQGIISIGKRLLKPEATQ